MTPRSVTVLASGLVGLLGHFAAACECASSLQEDLSARPSSRTLRGNMDVSFLVTADTHFGVGVKDKDPNSKRSLRDTQGIEKHQLAAIESMNAIEGRPFPQEVGWSVGPPRGVLVAGDLTDTSHPAEWGRFLAYFGTDGTDGLLRFPVFETWGNHDKYHDGYIGKRIAQRHGDVRYTVDWQDLHVVCLGDAPDDEGLAWLERDLEDQGKQVGIIVYLHYPLTGPYSEENWFGQGDYRNRFGDVLSGYRVLGIFHGHYHASLRYRWRGLDVYNVGSPKHGYPSYAAVRLTDDRMVVGAWDYGEKRWDWVHDKKLE